MVNGKAFCSYSTTTWSCSAKNAAFPCGRLWKNAEGSNPTRCIPMGRQERKKELEGKGKRKKEIEVRWHRCVMDTTPSSSAFVRKAKNPSTSRDIDLMAWRGELATSTTPSSQKVMAGNGAVAVCRPAGRECKNAKTGLCASMAICTGSIHIDSLWRLGSWKSEVGPSLFCRPPSSSTQ